MIGTSDDKFEITDDCLLHRALRNAGLIEISTGRVKSAAFIRRRDENGKLKEEGLSVDIASMRSATDFARSFKKCYGVVGLFAGPVREIKLDIVYRPLDNAPSHAKIVGLPDDDAEEEHLAGLLAKLSTLIQP